LNENQPPLLHPMEEREKKSLPGRRAPAFTLIELLVVIAIIGVLAAVGLPAIRGMTKSNSTISSNRQLLDDISYARQRAISDHTTVFMVFVPPTVINYVPPGGVGISVLKNYTNLLGGQYTTYALLSMRQVGEQPGRATPRYLSEWRSLPNGVFIAAAMFTNTPASFPAVFNYFPFPVTNNYPGNTFALPYVAFNYLGQLVALDGSFNPTIPLAAMDIPVAHGSIFYARGADGNFINSPADVQENPPGNSTNNLANVIHIDGLTGRAKVVRQEVQ
jgi:prepilin-type N-terminal cleavage/methylation domain-containing protein